MVLEQEEEHSLLNSKLVCWPFLPPAWSPIRTSSTGNLLFRPYIVPPTTPICRTRWCFRRVGSPVPPCLLTERLLYLRGSPRSCHNPYSCHLPWCCSSWNRWSHHHCASAFEDQPRFHWSSTMAVLFKRIQVRDCIRSWLPCWLWKYDFWTTLEKCLVSASGEHCLAKIHTADRTRAATRTLECFFQNLLKSPKSSSWETSQNSSYYTAFTNTPPTLSKYCATYPATPKEKLRSNHDKLTMFILFVSKKKIQTAFTSQCTTLGSVKRSTCPWKLQHGVPLSTLGLYLFFRNGKQKIRKPCNSGNIMNIQPVLDRDWEIWTREIPRQ